MTDWTGKVLGTYRLDKALGPDRYGTRYRATDTGTGASVEVRLIAPPTADDRWFADRVASTLRRYDGISAPDLVPLLAVGDADGAVYTVGPLLAGETLRARLGAPLPLAEVVATLTPIAAALDALHARYLPHGGLQPEAIVLDPAGPLLCDAGVAPALAAAARLAAPAAAPPSPDDRAYRAPEALSGSSSDPRADIYSLAVVACEALTGRTPFAANGAVAQPATPRRDTPSPAPREQNPALTPATEAALLRGLAQYPYERPERASAFIASLAAGAPTAAAAAAAPVTPNFASAPTFAPPPAAWTSGEATPPPTTPAVTPSARRAATAALPLHSTAPPAPAIMPSVLAPAPTPPPPVVAPPLAPEPSHYQSPETPPAGPILAAPPGQALQAGRAALVTTLAALAQGQQRALGTLRAIEARPRATTSDAASRRPTPAERAARYAARTARERTEWREFYSVPVEEALVGVIGSLVPVFFVAIFIGSFVGRLGLFFLILMGTAAYGVAKVRFDTRRTIRCSPDGFAIEDTLLPGQTTSRAYRWSDVSDLRYIERLTGSQKSPKLIGSFVITVADRVVADCTDRYSGFDLRGLIDRFGRETTHLPYRWVPNDDPPVVSGGQRAERYAKIAREARPPIRVP